jgi:hypothetical protein
MMVRLSPAATTTYRYPILPWQYGQLGLGGYALIYKIKLVKDAWIHEEGSCAALLATTNSCAILRSKAKASVER